MKLKKRIAAIVLALAMTVTLVPQTVFADTEEGSSGLQLERTVPDEQAVEYGGSTTLGVIATATDGSEDELTYQWWQCVYNSEEDYWSYDTEITGATESSYTVENVTKYSGYMCWVKDKHNNDDMLYFYVYPDSGLTVEAADGGRSQKVSPGGNATFGVIATVADGSEDKLTYQWRRWYGDKDGNYLSEELLQTGGTSYTVENVTEKVEIRCTVTDQYGYSVDEWFYAYPDSGLELKRVGGFTQKVKPGENITLNVTATVKDGSGEKLTYEWRRQFYDSEGKWLKTETIATVAPSYTFVNVMEYLDVFCEVTDQYGYSDIVGFSVYPDSGLTADSSDGITDKKVTLGGNAVLSVNASVTDGSGDRLTYRWIRYSYDQSGEYLSSETVATGVTSYTVENVTSYVEIGCRVTDAYGYSQWVFFDVHPDSGLTVAEASDEKVDKKVALGGDAELSVNASVTDGTGDKLTYTWIRNSYDLNGNYVSSETVATGASSYTEKNVTSYVEIECRVADAYGYSETVYFDVHPDSGLKVAETYKKISVAKNGSVTLAVNASVNDGSQITRYDWVCEELGVVASGTDNTYTLENVTEANLYWCSVLDQYGYWVWAYFDITIDGETSANPSDSSEPSASNPAAGDVTGGTVAGDVPGNSETGDKTDASGSNDTTAASGTGDTTVVSGTNDVAAGSGIGDVTGSTGSNNTTNTSGADNTAPTASNTASASGKTTETSTETNAAGKTVTVTTTTKTDANGNVTSVTEKSVIEKAAKNTTATVTVEKNADGKVTSAEAAVTQKTTADGKKNKVSISASVVSQIQEAAGQKNVDITLKAVNASGKTKYTVTVNAKDVKAGKSLYAYTLNSKTGEYTMVDSNTYTVSKKGTVSISESKKANYALVSASDAKKINKDILATAKLTKTSKTVKNGKTASVTISKKLNTSNVESIKYTTSKKSVATVSKKGKVTAKSAGTATIKAKVTFKNGSVKTLKLKVSVK